MRSEYDSTDVFVSYWRPAAKSFRPSPLRGTVITGLLAAGEGAALLVPSPPPAVFQLGLGKLPLRLLLRSPSHALLALVAVVDGPAPPCSRSPRRLSLVLFAFTCHAREERDKKGDYGALIFFQS